MKRAIPFWAVVGLVALCGCANPYVITLRDGKRLTTPHKPKLVQGVYVYEDAQGRKNYVSAGRVREVAPASMSTSATDKFKTSSGK